MTMVSNIPDLFVRKDKDWFHYLQQFEEDKQIILYYCIPNTSYIEVYDELSDRYVGGFTNQQAKAFFYGCCQVWNEPPNGDNLGYLWEFLDNREIDYQVNNDNMTDKEFACYIYGVCQMYMQDDWK